MRPCYHARLTKPSSSHFPVLPPANALHSEQLQEARAQQNSSDQADDVSRQLKDLDAAKYTSLRYLDLTRLHLIYLLLILKAQMSPLGNRPRRRSSPR